MRLPIMCVCCIMCCVLLNPLLLLCWRMQALLSASKFTNTCTHALCLAPMQVVLQFPAVFWDESVDYFGAAPEGGPTLRGRCSTFWNLHRWAGKPILIGLLSGLSADQVCMLSTALGSLGLDRIPTEVNLPLGMVPADDEATAMTLATRACQTFVRQCQLDDVPMLPKAEKDDDETTVAAAMAVLRRLHGDAIPEPTATHVSRWGSDPYSRGEHLVKSHRQFAEDMVCAR